MASIANQLRNSSNFLLNCSRSLQISGVTRCLGTTPQLLQKEEEKDKVTVPEQKPGFFKNLLKVRTLQPSKESHSAVLSKKEVLYELQFHHVKPEYMEEYLKQFSEFTQLMHDKKTGAELVGSFTVEIGDQDEAVHIWQYDGGYPALNAANAIYRTDEDFIAFRLNRNKMLRSRKNQILLSFSFWPQLEPREGNNIYEMRTYTLKPGTMIEWANNWARGIQYREESKPVCGFFAQIGELYTVHHFWCYESLQARKDTRESAWSKPGWDECVAYTVPLIRHMRSRILIPTPFSKLQ